MKSKNATVDWVDPRPARTEKCIADRPSSETKRNLVFFDNLKLSPPYDRWLPFVPPLVSCLERIGTLTREHANLLFEPVSEYSSRIAEWKSKGVNGIVFGLCDAGVVQPTLMLAARTEWAGIPTVVLCTDQVMALAAISVYFLAPGLPLVLLSGGRLDTPAEMDASARSVAEQIVQGLTRSQADLRAEFEKRFQFVTGLAASENEHPKGDFNEFARRNRLTDGLPVLQPTTKLVEKTISVSRRKRDEIIIEHLSPSGSSLNVEQAAICSVMAGCIPERFPFVLAALEAMASPEYQLHLGSITTHPGGNLILFSGPATHDAGIASGGGCLGPGHEANLTIGRAISLVLNNVGRAIPGLSSLTTMGSPAQISCCFADATHRTWARLNEELSGKDETIVWVQKCEGPHNVMDHLSSTPESLLTTIASVAATIGGNNACKPSDLLVILNPEHADIVIRAGWSRKDVRNFLWEKARNVRSELSGKGAKPNWPDVWHTWDRVPVVPSPDGIRLVVAGSPGPHSMVAIPWGFAKAAWRRVNI